MSSSGLAHNLSLSGDTLRFPRSTRPDNPPQFVSFRPRLGPAHLRSTLNDTVSEAAAAMSFYEMLGIPETGSLLEIKQAYKQLARKYHPDVSPPGRAEEYTQHFIRVQEAYETLSDPSRRALYDRHMATGLHLAFAARRRGRFNEVRTNWIVNFFFLNILFLFYIYWFAFE